MTADLTLGPSALDNGAKIGAVSTNIGEKMKRRLTGCHDRLSARRGPNRQMVAKEARTFKNIIQAEIKLMTRFLSAGPGRAVALAATMMCLSLYADPAAARLQAGVVQNTQLNGQHDFDFLIGSWNIHLRRLVHPLSGSSEWVELDGTVDCRTVFEGRAEVEEFKVANADRSSAIEGLALRFYNPASRQWSIWWANAKDGSMSPPPVVGEFKDGRGEFIEQDTFNGRAVLIRFVWTQTNTDTPHFEQSLSADGGRTWEVNWITDQTKRR